MNNRIIFRGARVFDGESQDLLEGVDVLVDEGTISAVSESSGDADERAEVVDCAGRTLMPGGVALCTRGWGRLGAARRPGRAQAWRVAYQNDGVRRRCFSD